MKRGFNILLVIFAALLVVSCDKTKSYTDMLKAERKAIDRLIDSEGIEVLDDYPANGVFKSNQFVKLDNDVYLNVIDSGNGQRAELGKTKILGRFIAKTFLKDSVRLAVDNYSAEYNSYWGFPVEFVFGYNVSTAKRTGYTPDYLVGEGLATALNYVGDSSYVKMIVPFKHFTGDLNSSGEPIYFNKVKYIFEK